MIQKKETVNEIFFLVVSFFYIQTLAQAQHNVYYAADKLFNRFEREFIIFDLSDNSNFMDSIRCNTNYTNFCYVFFGESKLTTNLRNKIIKLEDFPSEEDLFILSQCESPDIVLVNWDVLKKRKLTKSWKSILKMGMFSVFTQIDSNLKSELQKFCEQSSQNFCFDDITENYMIIRSKTKTLKLSAFVQENLSTSFKKQYRIQNSFKEKFFYKNSQRVNWVNGINLVTALSFKIVKPSIDFIIRQIYKVFSLEHADFRTWNLILQSDRLIPIDNDNRKCKLQEKISNLIQTLYFVTHPRKGILTAIENINNFNI